MRENPLHMSHPITSGVCVCVCSECGFSREGKETSGECQENAQWCTFHTPRTEHTIRILCVCVCVCVQARQRATENEKKALQTREILASIETVSYTHTHTHTHAPHTHAHDHTLRQQYLHT